MIVGLWDTRKFMKRSFPGAAFSKHDLRTFGKLSYRVERSCVLSFYRIDGDVEVFPPSDAARGVSVVASMPRAACRRAGFRLDFKVFHLRSIDKAFELRRCDKLDHCRVCSFVVEDPEHLSAVIDQLARAIRA